MPHLPDKDEITRLVTARLGTEARLGTVTIHNGAVGGEVGILLEVVPQSAAQLEPLRREVEQLVATLPGVARAVVILTNSEEQNSSAASGKGSGLDQIRHVIAVASGKGGVGKSTVAANLALALHAAGLRVGLLDADIYGPSVPTILGLADKPASDGQMLLPSHAYGLKAMSIGLLIDKDTAMVWRGPMATSALQQLLRDVAWGALDILVIDMPPGTGDIQLTLAQRANLAGAVIVSTPQDLALIDARKAINMFAKVAVPILGLIENMRGFACPNCGEVTNIFGTGGTEAEARRLDTNFLGAIPLDLSLRLGADSGSPIVASQPTSQLAACFHHIAGQLIEALAIPQKPMPAISMVD